MVVKKKGVFFNKSFGEAQLLCFFFFFFFAVWASLYYGLRDLGLERRVVMDLVKGTWACGNGHGLCSA